MRRLALHLFALLAIAAIVVAGFSCRSEKRSTDAQVALVQGRTPLASDPTKEDPPKLKELARLLGYHYDPASSSRTDAQMQAMNTDCVACHNADTKTMHSPERLIACVDCHGGNGQSIGLKNQIDRSDPHYEQYKRRAHVQPKHPEI